jgi:hypothetical protein
MNINPQDEGSLARLLQAWHVAPPKDPQFRPGVWARIEAARAALPWPAYVRLHAAALAGVLAVALVAGAWIGRAEARSRVAADRDTIAREYVQALDARAMTR